MLKQNELLSAEFVGSLHRSEFNRDPFIYMKAVRVTLIALGYHDDFINGDFYDFMLTYYQDLIDSLEK